VIQRVLRDTQATLEVTFYSGTTATDADAGVTITITKGDGTALVTDQATTHDGTGIYRYTLAPQADLNDLRCKWSGTFGSVAQSITTYAAIVGAFYVPLVDIRALDGLSSATTFPDQQLLEARQAFEDLAERFTGKAWVPRYGRVERWGDNTSSFDVRRSPLRKLLSVTTDAVATTFSAWTVNRDGFVQRDAGLFLATQRIVMEFEHGEDVPDAELVQATLRAVRKAVLNTRSGIPENALTMTTAEGGFTLGIAGENRPTGDPYIDGVLQRLKAKSPAGAPMVG
jgi:hypothetical protein